MSLLQTWNPHQILLKHKWLARFQSSSTSSPLVSFSSHLEERQLRLLLEVQEVRSYRLDHTGNQVGWVAGEVVPPWWGVEMVGW